MLVLSRKRNESVQIDSNIRVTVVSIRPGRVKLGISAPDDVRIVRTELLLCAPGMTVAHEEVLPRPAKGP